MNTNMTRNIAIIVAVVVIVGIIGYVVYANNNAQNYTTTTTTPTPTTTSMGTMTMTGSATATSTTTPTGSATTTSITIQNFNFSPLNMSVKVGSTITWTNKDSVAHSVVFTDGTQSSILNSGSSYSRTFTKAGTYTYKCGIHAFMPSGTITVQ